MAKKTKIEESTEYENCLDVKEFEDGTLSSFLGEEAVKDIEEKIWKKHWVGMPEFEQEDSKWEWHRLKVSFKNWDDYKKFTYIEIGRAHV